MRCIHWTASVLLCLLAPVVAAAQQFTVSGSNRVIQVSATGMASAPADSATLHVGFTAYGADSAAAYAAGSKLSNSIVDALTQSGVAKDAIESESQSVAEAQPYEMVNLSPEQRSARAYKVQQSWKVKTAAKDASRILDAAVKAGANASGQIDWGLNDMDALHTRAMQDAMSHARKRAEALAAGMGVKLGPVIYASNEAPQTPPIVPMAKAMMAAPASAPVEPLALGPQKISDSATVFAAYTIE